MATAHVVVLVSALLGWSDITIQPSRGDRGFSSFQHSLAGIDRPSERTLETLKRYDLERSYRRQRNVNNVLLSLEKVAQESGCRACLCACRALLGRRPEAGPLAQRPGDRPVPGCGRLCT